MGYIISTDIYLWVDLIALETVTCFAFMFHAVWSCHQILRKTVRWITNLKWMKALDPFPHDNARHKNLHAFTLFSREWWRRHQLKHSQVGFCTSLLILIIVATHSIQTLLQNIFHDDPTVTILQCSKQVSGYICLVYLHRRVSSGWWGQRVAMGGMSWPRRGYRGWVLVVAPHLSVGSNNR